MCVTVKFIATALLALFALPTVPCAGASLPAAAEPLQSAATQTLPGSYPRIVITGSHKVNQHKRKGCFCYNITISRAGGVVC